MVAQQQQDFLEAVLLGGTGGPCVCLPCERCAADSGAAASRCRIWLGEPSVAPLTYGCLAMRASSLAMFSGLRTKSTQPAATALRGIESYLADSSCAKVMPPSALIASSPSVPSVAVPERITPIARSRWSCASDSKKASIGWCAPRSCGRGFNFKTPFDDAQIRVGRNDINVIGLDPQIVGDLLHRHRSGPRQKLCQRAFMLRIQDAAPTRNPCPISSGKCFSNWVNASNPPADAPTPTIGKRKSERPEPGGPSVKGWKRRGTRMRGLPRLALPHARGFSISLWGL